MGSGSGARGLTAGIASTMADDDRPTPGSPGSRPAPEEPTPPDALTPPDPPPYRIAVVGAGRATHAEYETARALGRALAESGAVVVCGGRGGVMEAVARGVAEGGGVTVGILPGAEAAEANAWIGIPLATGMGEARNALVVRGAEAVVAVGGGWGTLSEIALARKMGRDVTTLGAPPADDLGLHASPDPLSAAKWSIEAARVYRRGRS